MEREVPTVSAVVLTWNSARHIGPALVALVRAAAGIPIEIIVVDNRSTDRSLEIVAAAVPDATVIRNPMNRGVAAARNQGAAVARGRFVLFLDSDTEMTPGSLGAMVAFLDTHQDVAVVGPRLVYPDGTLQYSSRRFPTVPGKVLRLLPLSWRRRVSWAADEELIHLDREAPQDVDYVIGACQLIRRDVLWALGGLDPHIFYGPEDVDFCLRAWQTGRRTCYLPSATVIHSEQRITHARPGLLTIRHGIAVAYYFLKHGYAFHRPRVRTAAAPGFRIPAPPRRRARPARRRPGRPRVLEIITLSQWGGAQAYVHALARGLSRAYEVTVACAPGGPLVSRLREAGIAVVEIPTLVRTPSLLDVITFSRLAWWMRRERFDVVHCHSTKAGLLGRFAAWLAGVPVILFTVHGWPHPGWWSPLVRRAVTLAERAAGHLSTAIVCVCEHDRRWALEMGIGRPHRLVVIHNGVPESPPAPRAAAPLGAADRAPGSAADDACTVVGVGRLTDQKDPMTLLHAWRHVPDGHRLLLVGDGTLRPVIEEAIRRDPPPGDVVLLGARDDVRALLSGADVFAIASRWEGLPLAVLEAMMCGLPVVATDVGGVGEAVVAGHTGLLVAPGDAMALAAALQRLLDDPEQRRRMGEAGRRRALERFTQARMLAATADLYARLLEAAGVQEGAGG